MEISSSKEDGDSGSYLSESDFNNNEMPEEDSTADRPSSSQQGHDKSLQELIKIFPALDDDDDDDYNNNENEENGNPSRDGIFFVHKALKMRPPSRTRMFASGLKNHDLTIFSPL